MTEFEKQKDVLQAAIDYLENHRKSHRMQTAIFELKKQLNLAEIANDKRK